ncbi:MAG: TetR/AcrR family transcriptional regulator [Lysinibacillus sp.]
MGEKQDRRIIRTKREIKEAFISLLEEKSFDSITVRDLTERANINRGTFYLHYLDKFDLLEKCEEEVFSNILSIFNAAAVIDILQGQDMASRLPFFTKVFEYLQEEAAFMKVILGPNGDPSFQEKVRQVFIKNIHDNILSEFDMASIEAPIDLFTTYISSAHLGVIQYWLNSGMKQSPKELTALLFNILMNGPVKASGLIVPSE